MKYARALVTGASSGIGLACAEELAAAGMNLILVARRKDKLDKLRADLVQRYGVEVEVHSVDIQSRASVERLFKSSAEFESIDVLVNNAGLARGTEKLFHGKFNDWDEMIDTNIKGLLYMTRLAVEQMVRRDAGHVINIGSVAGRWVYPGGGVYCASKFAVRAITEGLRMDLMGTKVRVTNIEPGMVDSEFSMVRFQDKDKAKAVYQGMTPLSPKDVAETVRWCLDRPAHVNIQELVIFPTDQAAIQHVHRKG